MSALNTSALAEATKRWAAKRAQADEAESLAKQLKADVEAEAAAIVEMLTDAGLSSTKIVGVGTLSISHKDHDSCPQDRMPSLCDLLEELGYAAVVKRTVHPSTLSSLMKELRGDPDRAEQLQQVEPLVSTYTKYWPVLRK